MALDWDRHRGSLRNLWITLDMTHDKIVTEMKRLHNFHASKSQYVEQFQKWGWKKNIAGEDWILIDNELLRRKAKGLESAVYLNGTRLPDAKIRKEIGRHVTFTSKFKYSTSGPLPPHIQIRTPESPANTGCLDMSNCAMIPRPNPKRKRSFQHGLALASVKTPCIVSSRELTPNGASADDVSSHRLSLDRTGTIRQIIPVAAQSVARIPYVEFLDWFRSLDISKSFFQVKFFDQAPSPSLLPSNSLLSTEILDFDWRVDENNDRNCNAMEGGVSSNPEAICKFYESLANFLIPCGALDRLDANRRLQEQLPVLLANMPVKTENERDSIVQDLLGPPQLSAALRVLEIVVYLYSNGLLDLNHITENNTVLNWIVKVIPFENLSIVLRTGLPTLQAFQSALFLFGITTCNFRLVKGLLDLEAGYQDFFLFSPLPLRSAVRTENAEMVNLVLSGGTDLGLRRYDPPFGPFPSGRLIIQIAKSLTYAHWLRSRKQQPFFEKVTVVTSPPAATIGPGYIALAQYLLRTRVDVNSWWLTNGERFPRRTILRLVVASGQSALLRMLLDYGTDIHAVCQGRLFDGKDRHDIKYEPSQCFTATALQAAAAGGRIEIVAALLEAGSRINEPAHGENGQTALHAATNAGRLEIVEFLLKRGAEPNALGTSCLGSQRMVLLTAVEKNDVPLVKVLLKYGADPNIPIFSCHGTTILEVAKVLKSNTDIVSAILAAGAKDTIQTNDSARRWYMSNQLVQAVINADLQRIYRLIDTGASVDMEPIEYTSHTIGSAWCDFKTEPITKGTVLHWAICSKKVDLTLFRYLVSHVTDINDQTSTGLVPPVLHEAVRRQRIDFVETLLQAGANVNTVSSIAIFNSYKYSMPTALHVAAFQEDFNMVSLLLDQGADINIGLSGKGTPLQALLSGHRDRHIWGSPGPNLELFELLLSRCTDTNTLIAADMYGKTVLQQAVSETINGPSAGGPHWVIILQRLLDLGANVNAPAVGFRGLTALQKASACGCIDLVKLLLDHGANVNAPAANNGGRTALQAASGKANIKLVKLLLEYGANVNAPAANNSGCTALQAASGKANIKLVKLLLEHGAELNAPAGITCGATALQAASDSGNIELVMLLLQYGAELNAPASRSGGKTALQYAAENGHIKIAQLLLANGADVNDPGSKCWGYTALELAASYGRLDMVHILVDAGAESYLPKGKRYASALRFASDNSHYGVVLLLQKYKDMLRKQSHVGRLQDIGPDESLEDDQKVVKENPKTFW